MDTISVLFFCGNVLVACFIVIFGPKHQKKAEERRRKSEERNIMMDKIRLERIELMSKDPHEQIITFMIENRMRNKSHVYAMFGLTMCVLTAIQLSDSVYLTIFQITLAFLAMYVSFKEMREAVYTAREITMAQEKRRGRKSIEERRRILDEKQKMIDDREDVFENL